MWAILGLIGTSLVGAIGFLVKLLKSVWDNQHKRIEQFEDERVDVTTKIENLISEVSELRGREDGQRMVLEATVKEMTNLVRESQREFLSHIKDKKDNDR